MMAQAAKIDRQHVASGSTDDFYRAKLVTARYFVAHVLPQASGPKEAIVGGSAAVLDLPDSLFWPVGVARPLLAHGGIRLPSSGGRAAWAGSRQCNVGMRSDTR